MAGEDRSACYLPDSDEAQEIKEPFEKIEMLDVDIDEGITIKEEPKREPKEPDKEPPRTTRKRKTKTPSRKSPNIKELQKSIVALKKKNSVLEKAASATKKDRNGAINLGCVNSKDSKRNVCSRKKSPKVCQLCLVTDVKLHSMNSLMQRKLLALLGIQGEPYTSYVCYECFALTRRLDQLRDKSHRAQLLLASLAQSVRTVTAKLVSQSVDRAGNNLVSSLETRTGGPEIHIVYDETEHTDRAIKNEIADFCSDVADDDFKWETSSEQEYGRYHDDFIVTNDKPNEIVEVNIPLNKSAKADRPKKRISAKKPATNNKVISDDYEKHLMTYEQAMEEMNKKRTSPAYLKAVYKCELCCRVFIKKQALENHIVSHDPARGEMECDFCHFRANHRRKFLEHMAIYHTYTYICKRCSSVCNTRKQAEFHRTVHTTEVHKCKQCDKTFARISSLTGHVHNKHGRNFVCDLCGRDFGSQLGITNHKSRMHILDKDTDTSKGPRCEPCQVQFASDEALKRHLIISSKHRLENSCAVCTTTFNSREDLKEHEKIHKEDMHYRRANPLQKVSKAVVEWPVKCDKCDALLHTGAERYRHYKKEHPGEPRPELIDKNYICDICGISRTSKALIEYHRRKHQEKTFKCPECPKSFVYRRQYKMHLALHTGELLFVCHLCGNKFNNKSNLKRHLDGHKGLQYKCDYCNKNFTTSYGRDTHVQYVHLKKAYKKRDRSKRNDPNYVSTHSTRRILTVDEPEEESL